MRMMHPPSNTRLLKHAIDVRIQEHCNVMEWKELVMRHLAGVIVAILAVIGDSSILSAATLALPADVSFTAECDGTTQLYSRLLPTDFDASRTYDILIALHGHGSTRSQYASSTLWQECIATRDIAAKNDMIMICPDYRATTSWMNAAAEADMVQIIQNLKSQYHVGKVVVTGGSMGGTGSLTFTALHPNLVDGVCSVNGLANFVGFESSNSDLLPAIAASFGGTYEKISAEYAKRSAINSPGSFTMPMAITAGGADTTVPAQSVLQLYDTVKNTNPKNSKTVSVYRPTTGHSTSYVDNAVALEYVIQNAKGVDTDLHPITINTSFEYETLSVGATSGTVRGWTTAGSAATVARLSNADYAAKFDDAVPDGSQIAMVKNSAIYQFLGTTARAGTYHLSVKVGSPKDNSAVGTFRAGFLTAASNIAATSDLIWADDCSWSAAPGLVEGKWSSVEWDWTVGADSSAIGKYLYVNLLSTGSNYVCFDDVHVTYTATPEPGALTLCIAGLSGWLAHALRRYQSR